MTQFAVKSSDEIRDDYLRTYASALMQRGVPNPNVSSGTEIYARAQALANQIAVATAGIPDAQDAQMPDTSQGADLQRDAKIHGLELKPAGGSAGPLVLTLTVATPSLVVTGAQLLDGSGQSYKVAVGGSYSTGATIPIEATSLGLATNLAVGTVLRWVSPPPFSTQTAVIGAGGLTGGVDAETIEGLRARYLAFLRDPPNGSNAAQFCLWAEASTVAVQKAFCYPCYYGPDTVQVCVVGAPTATNKTRQVDATTLSTIVEPYIASFAPEHAELLVTTAADLSADVTIGLTLPISAAAGGPGGGWTDATPWPVRVSTGHADVTATTSNIIFTVNADAAPTAGVTQIAWVSTSTWQLYTATVLSYTGAGPYTVTVDQPFVGIATGDYVMPNAENLATYVEAALDHFAAMGPGHVTSVAGLLPRGLRKPAVEQSWPCALDATMLRAVESSGDEVLDTTFLYRSALTPPTPANPGSGPQILVPEFLAFYPI